MNKDGCAALCTDYVARCRAAGVSVRRPATESEFAAFERRFGVPLPECVQSLLSVADGMDEGDADENGIRFWPLEAFRPVSEELPTVDRAAHAGLFVFADYSMWAHAYAVDLSPGGVFPVFLVGGEEPLPIAPTFADFMRGCVRDQTSLFPHEGG